MIRARLPLTALLLALVLALGLGACGTTETAGRSATGGSGSGAAGNDGRPALVGLRTESAGRQTRVVLQGNQQLTYTAMAEKLPPAIVVDVGGGPGSNVVGQTVVKNGLIDKISVEPLTSSGQVSRVRIDLTKPTSYQAIREDSNLVILVENAPGDPGAPIADMDIGDAPLTAAQMSGGTAMVTGVDFKPVGTTGRTRLMIRADRLVTPQVLSRDNGRTVVLSIAPADIQRPLIRSLDTAYFRSAVDYVKPTQSSGTSVEFTVRLREVVPYHLGQKGAVTYLDFDPAGTTPRMTQATDYRAPVTYAGPPAATASTAGAPAGSAWTSAKSGAATTAAVPTAAKTQAKKPGEPKVYTGQKITLDFQNADIHNILRLIGEVSGKNVVVSDKVAGKVTLKLNEVPWDQALDIVLAANQLDMVESGNVIRIDKADILRAERDSQFKDAEQQVERQKNAPLDKKIFTPKYASVDVMKTELTKLKSDRGKLTVIGNDIYVEDETAILAAMSEALARIDRVAKQILIESRIVEAQSNFAKSLGVNWGGNYGATETSGPLGGNTWGIYGAGSGGVMGAGGPAVNLITAPATGLALGFGLISSRLNLDAKLYAMEKTGEGRVVSAPRILASNDQKVYIQQGESIPYETTGTTTTASSISYKEALLKLEVTPHIEENDKIVTMALTVTKQQADWSRSTRNPPINTREAQTKLMVRNGETVVIGGIIVDQTSKTINRVPGLHRIPVLGWLFKDYEVSDSKLELLIFLTCNIIPVNI